MGQVVEAQVQDFQPMVGGSNETEATDPTQVQVQLSFVSGASKNFKQLEG